MFNPEIYVNRRKKLAEKFNSGILLFPGNEESPMNYPGNVYPFRQDSTFLYYWGLNEPGLDAVIDLDENKEIIFGYDFTVDDVVWMGPQLPLKEKALKTGVRHSATVDDLTSYLRVALEGERQIHFLPQYRPSNLVKLEKLLDRSAIEVNSQFSEQLIKAVVSQRSIKSGEEIEEIGKALDISYEVHTLAMKMMKPGLYERDIAGAIQGKALQMGGRLSFPLIFSTHGETLHNIHYHHLMKVGDMVVNDCGGESAMGYAGDITRTIPVSGKFSSSQREIYQVVLNAQKKAIESIQPGAKYLDIHLLAAKEIASGLFQLGLMKGSVDEAVKSGAHALFFPHGLGHMMGLDVHDMESLGEDYVGYDESVKRSNQFGLAYLRLAKALQPGYVLTVEPGIYFIPELIDQWKAEKKFAQFIDYEKVEKYRNFGGIRIEDDVLVTETGHQVLGKPIPKLPGEVEEMVGS